MERKRYLELCQRFSADDDVCVLYDGRKYRPIAYEIAFDKEGNAIHKAILHEYYARSVMCCRLGDVLELGD